VLILVGGSLQLLVPLFDQNFTRTVEISMKGAELPRSLGNLYKRLHHRLEMFIRKNICSQETGAGLSWVVVLFSSVIRPA
jgi:hypothetical protein